MTAVAGGQCRKVPFASYAAAEDALLAARIRRAFGSQRRRECRAYYHRACGAWHLTSKPAATQAI